MQDKKFWAFLNGYLNLKMSMLLENQHSIIESTVQMFVTKEVQAGMRRSKVKGGDEEMERELSIGQFLLQLDEPSVLIKFTNFLAKEMLEDSERIRRNGSDEDGQIQEEAQGAIMALQAMIDKNTQKFDHDQDNFDIEAFEKEQ